MGTDNDTKGSNPSKIEPLKEYSSDQETFQSLDERDMLEPLNEAPPDGDEQQDGYETETPVVMQAVEAEIDLNDSDQPAGNISGSDEIEIDFNSGGEKSKAIEKETGENGTEFDETEDIPDDIEGKSEEGEETPDESESDPEGEEEESEEPDASDDTRDTQLQDAADPVAETTGDSDESSDDDPVDEGKDSEANIHASESGVFVKPLSSFREKTSTVTSVSPGGMDIFL